MQRQLSEMVLLKIVSMLTADIYFPCKSTQTELATVTYIRLDTVDKMAASSQTTFSNAFS